MKLRDLERLRRILEGVARGMSQGERGVTSAIFRFDQRQHRYLDPVNGKEFPHITGMLERAGWIDDRWYTEESSARGHAVHRLTADYDLGAIDVATVVDGRRGYLLGHAKAMAILRPEILAVEEPFVHPELRFGGRPDRELKVDQLLGVLEHKSGGEEESHQIQTALQAILVAPKYGIPPEMIARWALYLKDNGKFRLIEHRRRSDFDEARRIIRLCT